MATKSPGVYFNEIDNTQYESDDIKSISGTTLAVIGYATKGPTDFPIEIGSWKDYVNIFGGPVKGKYSGLMIKNFLSAGGRILFKRVIDKETASHSNYVVKNGQPQIEGTTTFNREGDFLKSETESGKLYGCTIDGKPFYVRAPKDGKRMTLASVVEQLNDGLGTTKALFEAELKSFEYTDFFGFGIRKEKNREVTEPTDFSFVELDGRAPKETIINNIKIAAENTNSITIVKFSKSYNKLYSDKNYSLNGPKVFNIDGGDLSVTFAGDENNVALIAKKIGDAVKDLNIKVIGAETEEADKLIFIRNTVSTKEIEIKKSTGEGDQLFLNAEEVTNANLTNGTGKENSLFVTETMAPVAGKKNNYVPTIKLEENSNHIVAIDTENNDTIEIVGYGDKPLELKNTLKIPSNGENFKDTLEIFKDFSMNKVVVKKSSSAPSYLSAPVIASNGSNGDQQIEVGDLFELMKKATSEPGKREIFDSEMDYVIFYSKEVGSGTTTLSVEVTTSKNPVNKNDVMKSLIVYNNGNIVERYDGISLDPTDDENYFKTVINAPVDDGGSSYIGVEVVQKGSNDIVLPDGFWKIGQANKANDKILTPDIKEKEYDYYNYMVGEDGIPQDDIDGSDGSSLFEEALDPINSPLSNKELYDFHIIQTPDNVNPVVQDACIKMCETRGDAITIVDPPESLSRDEVIAWHNGETGRASLDSNYAAVYWPWCKVYDTTAGKGKYSWVMPSVVMAAQYAKVDKSVGPQMAPAGEKNGLLPVIDIENYPNPNDRDALYTNLNRINPISKFRDGSVVAYGEKTTQRKETVLTKIHTRRMLVQIKKQCRAALRGYIFMPNTTDYLGKISNAMVAILEPYKANGGLNSYKVICDETNNPVESRQQDIINVDVVLIPQGTIEQININLTLDKAAETVKD